MTDEAVTRSSGRLLPDWLDSLADIYTSRMEPPYAYILWQGIAAISAVLERKCYYAHGADLTFYPNMFIILVGHSGMRKSVAVKLVARLLKEVQYEVGPESSSSSKLLDYMQEVYERKGHASVAIFASELSGFLKSPRADSELFKRLMAMYDCDEQFLHDTRSAGLAAPRFLYLTLTGGMTEEGVNQNIPHEVVGEGFTARVVFVFADTLRNRDGKPNLYDTSERRHLRDKLVNDLSLIGTLQGAFAPDPSWLARWERWYLEEDEKTGIPGKAYEGYNSRRGTHLIKLSMISSASRGMTKVLTEADFTRSLKWLLDAEVLMPRVIAAISPDALAAVRNEVTGIVERQGAVLLSELYHYYRSTVPPSELQRKVLDELVKAGYCTKHPVRRPDGYQDVEYRSVGVELLERQAKMLTIRLKRK